MDKMIESEDAIFLEVLKASAVGSTIPLVWQE